MSDHRLRAAVKAWVPPSIRAFYRHRQHQAAVARLAERHGGGARPTLPEHRLADLLGTGDGATPELRLPAAMVDAADDWTMPAAELAALAAVCALRRPRRIFEFGTYTGLATLVMAMNTPEETEIFTLDLPPAARAAHVHGLGRGLPDFVVGAQFAAHPAGARVRQLLGDARSLDVGPWRSGVDLVVIDSDHTYEFVAADTARALAMLRPGGLLVWDDYVWTERAPECAGVTRCVNELAAVRPVHRIAGTRLAMLVDGGPRPT